jgi:very-short-patch-repair endonuclease
MTRKSSLSDEDKRAITERYAAGAGIVQLAREYHCRTSQINGILQDAGQPRQSLTANTPIECRLHDALMAAGIGFRTQRRLVGRYVVDIIIHQAPVIIEADGARHRAGTQAQERDAVRDAAHEAAGYRVFRFSGSEINTDAVKCIQQVIDACGLVPDKNPVYDIRTKFSGDDHPRWVGLYELTCAYCGEKFQSKRARRKYCCHEHFILDAVKGKEKSPEHGAKIGEANRRRVITPETRAKMSAAKKGKPSSSKGKPKSPETRAKISASLTGRRQSDETRAKKSAAHLGMKHTPETRAKISASMRSNQTVIEPDPLRE